MCAIPNEEFHLYDLIFVAPSWAKGEMRSLNNGEKQKGDIRFLERLKRGRSEFKDRVDSHEKRGRLGNLSDLYYHNVTVACFRGLKWVFYHFLEHLSTDLVLFLLTNISRARLIAAPIYLCHVYILQSNRKLATKTSPFCKRHYSSDHRIQLYTQSKHSISICRKDR